MFQTRSGWLGKAEVTEVWFDPKTLSFDDLLALHEAHPEVELPHPKALAPALGSEASGFGIRDYPEDIVTDAFASH